MAENEVNAVSENVPKKKKKKHGFLIFLLILLILAVGFLAYLGGQNLYNKYSPYYAQGGFKGLISAIVGNESLPAAEDDTVEVIVEEPTPAPAVKSAVEEKTAEDKDANDSSTKKDKTSSNAGSEMTAADVYEANVNSTVAITTHSTINYWGQQIESGAKGSGFIVTEDGYILTNYHVIEDSDAVTVAAYDGSEYDAKIVGYDESNDIAVLKIEGENLKAVTLGDSDELRVGDEVIAIGNPLGELTFSMTKGYVSALNRSVQLSKNNSMKLIQTDCAINSGNSGGALFNMKGEVVGITNAKYSSSSTSSSASIEGIGFAIPINTVGDIVASIIENGYILKPYIGISVQTLSSDAAKVLDIEGGAIVGAVSEDSPAEEAGIELDDIIYMIDGKNICSSSELVEAIAEHKQGDEVTLSIYRDKKEIEVKVIVGAREEAAMSNIESNSSVSSENSNQNGGSSSGNYYNDEIFEFFKQFGIPGIGY